MTTKRAYKLQEFVAHSGSVNCLKIGRKTSRVLVTGGEDHAVNLWAIGKPNPIQSLSGHTSGIDSITFDSSEVLVAAGAASGTVKLWDLEEAKVVRTLTGHRSNCISVDFHPFGEFFASGSLDTNLKIWDIRKKGCIHTYKGHTRGVNAIRFTPDGRWIVSGGEDNTVKLWDLTAGKLLHDFKYHEGQIQCIEFHPNEFLLATGSADRTVKFWDLETFELIGSAGPETTGVRCLTFNPDGRTLLCGLHESLKVFSWEPIICNDAVDVGWSKLSDLNVHEGKLLGCSYNQNCVGVWVVDILGREPYAVGNVTKVNGHTRSKSCSSGNLLFVNENTARSTSARPSISQPADPLVKETKSIRRLSISPNLDPVKESNILTSTGTVPDAPQKVLLNSGSRETASGSVAAPGIRSLKRNSLRTRTTTVSRLDVVPVIVPRTHTKLEQAAESQKDINFAGGTVPFSLQTKASDFQKFSDARDEEDRPMLSVLSEHNGSKTTYLNRVADRKPLSAGNSLSQSLSFPEKNSKDDRCIGSGRHEVTSVIEPMTLHHENYESLTHKVNRDACSFEVPREGRTRLRIMNMEKRENSSSEAPYSISSGTASTVNTLRTNTVKRRTYTHTVEKESVLSDEDAIRDLLEEHDHFVSSMLSRSAKLQAVFRYWERHDIKGAIVAMEKMADHAVAADVLSILMETIDIVTLEISSCLFPLLTSVLDSKIDRHLSISLEMLLKLVRIFGSVIYSALSAPSSVGVDIEAEQRLERCKICFVELEKVKRCLPALTRRGGTVAKCAQELNLALQEVS